MIPKTEKDTMGAGGVVRLGGGDLLSWFGTTGRATLPYEILPNTEDTIYRILR